MIMDANSFIELAQRVLAGETTAVERQTFEAELSEHPERRQEFDQMKITHDILRTVAPLTAATQATAPELPAYRVNQLRTAVRQHFGAPVRKPNVSYRNIFRWIFMGSGATAVAALVLIFSLANRTIEVGLYQSDEAGVRGGGAPLSAQDVPAARIVTFDQDASFDQWQNQPLGWNQRAKIWVDNEHDLLHIVRREAHGHILMQDVPLASTTDGQREQIRQTVESLEK
jgi:hypothetical protein